MTPDQFAAGQSEAVHRVLVGLAAEAPLRANGRVAITPICTYSFGTRGTLFGNAVKQDASLTAEVVRRLLANEAREQKGCNTLGFDPAARRQDGAVIGPDPSADGVRGVPGLVPLMLRGLATVAPMPGIVKALRAAPSCVTSAGGSSAGRSSRAPSDATRCRSWSLAIGALVRLRSEAQAASMRSTPRRCSETSAGSGMEGVSRDRRRSHRSHPGPDRQRAQLLPSARIPDVGRWSQRRQHGYGRGRPRAPQGRSTAGRSLNDRPQAVRSLALSDDRVGVTATQALRRCLRATDGRRVAPPDLRLQGVLSTMLGAASPDAVLGPDR